MASKPTVATRASSRTKTAPSFVPAPTTTRTTRTRTITTKAATPTAATTVKSTKPAVERNLKPASRLTAKKVPSNSIANDAGREPIMAYLRIRPYLGDNEDIPEPYLERISDTTVRMSDPNEQSNPTRFRVSTLPPSSSYTFSHIFSPDATQSDFFTKTTLPLVRDSLQGQSGLLFTYGVTNSGKTYTIQGGTTPGSAGILPRTLDVLFNSIEGLHGDGRFRPVRLCGVEDADPSDSKPTRVAPEPALAEVLGTQELDSMDEPEVDSTVVTVDRNYEYTIYISYAEVYNEKIYDLLDSVKDDAHNGPSGIPQAPTAGKPVILTRAALPLKPSPPYDNLDSSTTGKYISGLRQFRVHSAAEAKALVKLGQLHRRVFGTLANSESSRSHGMVIIKVVKVHKGEKDDPTALQISRLTLVDLAGSERMKHTHTTGDRLREAGNINKSLMVLGQCMEVLRSNQKKLAMSLAQSNPGKDGRMSTKDVKRTLAVVPFRHSKLTEALMDYFVGDGKAVMIVNVNPYDTGFDENSHVMRFAALAREIYVTPTPAPVHRVKGSTKVTGNNGPEAVPKHNRRKVTISVGGPGTGKKPSEAILEVLEEDEPNDEVGADDSDEPINPLVDALFDEVEFLRMQLFESEMRCAVIEAETREEVMQEMEERMRKMDEMYARRLAKELEQNELKTDAKIDMLHHSGLFGSPMKQRQIVRPREDVSEEEEMEEDEEDDGESVTEHSQSPSMSPLAAKGKGNSQSALSLQTKGTPEVIREVRNFVPDEPDTEEAELTDTEAADSQSVEASLIIGRDADEDDEEEDEEEEDDEEEDDDDSYVEEDNEDDWLPPTSNAVSKTSKVAKAVAPSPSHKPVMETAKDSTSRVRVSKLAHDMDELSLDGPDDSVVILPPKKNKARQSSTSVEEEDEEGTEESDDDPPVLKKKKRILGKKNVMTEEEIERRTSVAERNAAKAAEAKSIRRLTGR